MKIVITVVVALSLAVAPAMQAQAARDAESEAVVRDAERFLRYAESFRSFLSDLCESYGVRADAIVQELLSDFGRLDVLRAADAKNTLHGTACDFSRDTLTWDYVKENIEQYRSGDASACVSCITIPFTEALTLLDFTETWCSGAREQVHDLRGTTGELNEKARMLAQRAVDGLCPLSVELADKYDKDGINREMRDAANAVREDN